MERTKKQSDLLKAIVVQVDSYYDEKTKEWFYPINDQDIDYLKELQKKGVYVIPFTMYDSHGSLEILEKIRHNSFGDFAVTSGGAHVSNFRMKKDVAFEPMSTPSASLISRAIVKRYKFVVSNGDTLYSQNGKSLKKLAKKVPLLNSIKQEYALKDKVYEKETTHIWYDFGRKNENQSGFLETLPELRRQVIDRYTFCYDELSGLVFVTKTGVTMYKAIGKLLQVLGIDADKETTYLIASNVCPELTNTNSKTIVARYRSEYIFETNKYKVDENHTIKDCLKNISFNNIK